MRSFSSSARICWLHCALARPSDKGLMLGLAIGAISALFGTAAQSENRKRPVPDDLSDIRYQVALANRMLANEGVLDAFGHVSMRHPADPGRYLLSRSRSPALIEPDDILEFTLDSAPVEPPTAQLYAERVIHGCIYQARADVMAVCHHHAPPVMPFCITGAPLIPLIHVAAIMGDTVPFWDQRDDFGDSNLLVVKPEEGRSLARALGAHSAVLMRRHGATVVGLNVRELVFRSIAMCQNAEYQMRALALGSFGPLTPGETRLSAAINLSPGPLTRAWDYWTARAEQAGAGLRPGTGR
jgi:ribulose-5-phosphate 4-epimerase/fuculose-1-phosphate aldolase